jgi:hypothetical protein
VEALSGFDRGSEPIAELPVGHAAVLLGLTAGFAIVTFEADVGANHRASRIGHFLAPIRAIGH